MSSPLKTKNVTIRDIQEDVIKQQATKAERVAEKKKKAEMQKTRKMVGTMVSLLEEVTGNKETNDRVKKDFIPPEFLVKRIKEGKNRIERYEKNLKLLNKSLKDKERIVNGKKIKLTGEQLIDLSEKVDRINDSIKNIKDKITLETAKELVKQKIYESDLVSKEDIEMAKINFAKQAATKRAMKKKIVKGSKSPSVVTITDEMKEKKMDMIQRGLPTCKKCLPDNFVETQDGDLVCTKCGLVMGNAFVAGLEKTEDGKLILRQADSFTSDENLSPETKANVKFERQLESDAEILSNSLTGPFGFTKDIKPAVKDMLLLIEKNPILRVDDRDRLINLAARLFVEYKIFDGRLLSKSRNRILKAVKSLASARGPKVDSTFDKIVKELENTEIFKSQAEKAKKMRINQRKVLADRRARPIVFRQVDKAKAEKQLRMILNKQTSDKIKKSAENLGIKINDKSKSKSKSKLIDEIIDIRMEKFERNITRKISSGKLLTQKRPDILKLETCQEKMKYIANNEGRKGIVREAKKVKVGDNGIINIKDKNIEQLITLICLADIMNDTTSKENDRRNAKIRFIYLNELDNKKSGGLKKEKKKSVDKELMKARSIMKGIKEKYKKQLSKHRRLLMVNIDPETGALKEVPNQKKGSVKAEAASRISFIVDPTRAPVFQPTNVKGLKQKIALREAAFEATEAKAKEQKRDDSDYVSSYVKRYIKQQAKNKEPVLTQIKKHPEFQNIDGRNNMSRDRLLKEMYKRGVTKNELLSIKK